MMCVKYLVRCLVHGSCPAPICHPSILSCQEGGKYLKLLRKKAASIKSTSGTFHPENQALSTHGVSLPKACSPKQHHMGLLDVGSSSRLQGGRPTLLKGPWAPQMNSGAFTESVVQTDPQHVLCPVKHRSDAKAGDST